MKDQPCNYEFSIFPAKNPNRYLSQLTIKKKRVLIFVLLFFLFTSFEKSFCQIEQIPERSTADRERERATEAPTEKKVPQPPKTKIEEEAPPEVLAGPEAEIKFHVIKIKIEGCTVLSQEELKKITAPYENKDLSLIELRVAADAITKLYRKTGYITSQAYVPPQKIGEGVAVIKVLEGKVGKIQLEGNRFFKDTLITSRLMRLKGKLFKLEDLKSALLYLNQNADLEVRVVLQRGEALETTDILLKVKDKYPHHLGYAFNNSGTRLTGNYRHIFSYNSTNFLGFGDLLSLQVPWANAGTAQGAGLNYIFAINDLGTKFMLTASLTKVKIGEEFKQYDVRSVSKSCAIYLQHPLFNTDRFSGEGRIGFEGINSYTQSLGDKITLNKTRALNFGFLFNEQDLHGRAFLSNEIEIGFPDILGASKKDDSMASPQGSGGKFFLYNLGVTRLEMLPFSSYLILNLQGQLTPDRLPAPKRYYLGGAYSVRGYPESDAVGDYGVNTIIELRTPCLIIFPKKISAKYNKLNEIMQSAFFIDTGTLYDRSSRKKHFLAGSGFGLRLNIKKYTTGRIDMAWPIGDEPSEEKEDNFRLHFSLEFRF